MLLLLFVAIDFVASNYHYSNLPVDGDLPRVVGPFKWYEKVLQDPIGIDAISKNEHYPAAGRYSCHQFARWWYGPVYKLIHTIVSNPVQSLYVTTTLLVALIHLSFIVLAFFYVKASDKFSIQHFAPIALLSSVFIQYGPFYDCIGFIDRSPLFVIFYALPVTVLLFYFLPFWQNTFKQPNKIPIVQHLLMFILAPILSFSGPLIQPIVLLVGVLYIVGVYAPNSFYNIKKNKALLSHLVFFMLWCIYAFVISRYNSESSIDKALITKYSLLAKGLFRIVSLEKAWPVLLGLLSINTALLIKKSVLPVKKIKAIYSFVLTFCVAYILLLPLGGYRVYREYIIRYDTFIPVSLMMLFLILYTTYHLLQGLNGKLYLGYTVVFLIVISLFTMADSDMETTANYCQQGALYEIIKSDEAQIPIEFKCNLLTWSEADVYDEEHMKGINRCLRRWGFISSEQTVYFTLPESSQ